MNITFISDTHNLHGKLTDYLIGGDILIHCGDITTHGTKEEVFDFLYWFDVLPYKYKIFVPGNHDFCLDTAKVILSLSKIEIKNIFPDIFYLNGDGLEIHGINFYGHGYTPYFQNMAFNCTADELEKHDSKIPIDVNILITHGPPKGYLDNGFGSASLAGQLLSNISPDIHAFGHIHESYGIINKTDGTTFINASNHTWLWKGKPFNYPIIMDYKKGKNV